ncbi:hypothetical protein [Ramlibacter sp.]|uniref:hypothetical protein n=1 Tax=Ramlibacter sp. TaxID=1917967 RepID=UPI00261F4996|nr:hypothetical protein [Ramlibacter sp.]MDB5958262.1 hypothetical protein [Ramlibacter sp.]
MKCKAITAAIATTTLLATGAIAQALGLVTVNVSNVANNIGQGIGVDAAKVPVTVQVPLDVATNVCGVTAAVLAPPPGGTAQCTATRTSPALNEAARSQMPRSTPG